VAEGREWQSEPAALEVGYERLRQAVLGGQPDGFRLGHGVLAARGLVAWMETVTSWSVTADCQQELSSAGRRGGVTTGRRGARRRDRADGARPRSLT
jgi:hypothetical protein